MLHARFWPFLICNSPVHAEQGEKEAGGPVDDVVNVSHFVGGVLFDL